MFNKLGRRDFNLNVHRRFLGETRFLGQTDKLKINNLSFPDKLSRVYLLHGVIKRLDGYFDSIMYTKTRIRGRTKYSGYVIVSPCARVKPVSSNRTARSFSRRFTRGLRTLLPLVWLDRQEL